MIVVEGTSLRQPCSWVDLRGLGHTVVSSKRPSPNTDYLCCRDINWRKPPYGHIPFMCYKWMRPNKSRTPSMENVWQADFKKWDKYFKTFGPLKHADPSSGTCAIFCAIERWQPKEIGIIGMDWVLDNNKAWFHDARAELEAIKSLVTVVDLRTEFENQSDSLTYCEKTLTWVDKCVLTAGRPIGNTKPCQKCDLRYQVVENKTLCGRLTVHDQIPDGCNTGADGKAHGHALHYEGTEL